MDSFTSPAGERVFTFHKLVEVCEGNCKALVVEEGAWVYELSLYVHLNPVMRRSLGLDKKGKRAEGAPRLTWLEVLEQVSVVIGAPAETYMSQWGGVGRPLALWAARRFGSMTLRDVGQAAGGMDYTAVSMAVKRLEQRAVLNE
jgi:hypothetical protein